MSTGRDCSHEVLNTLNTKVVERQSIGLELLSQVMHIPAGTKRYSHGLLVDVYVLQVGQGNDIRGLLGDRSVDASGKVPESMSISNNLDQRRAFILFLEE